MRTMSCLVMLALLALPAAALAQMGSSKSGMVAVATFKSLDRDGDAGLSRSELLARGREKGAKALFTLLDADSDGRLSLKEFNGSGSGPLLGRFDAYDANKDGFVARWEFPNYVDPRLVAALDRNRDNRVALGEIRPAFAGSKAVAAKAEPVRRKAVQSRPQTQPWCWITGFGSDQWTIEVPVSADGCRTNPAR